ncbi:cobalamin-binding protein [Bordetella genomosp. 13]|uniref:cobalamin-binding protein n=1 Tax=Bordetella genomosp. 13 TaxID=463040 RepID=UPI0021B5292D|nr:cobalamin-binding protein [Bordetella genomosp. 13]
MAALHRDPIPAAARRRGAAAIAPTLASAASRNAVSMATRIAGPALALLVAAANAAAQPTPSRPPAAAVPATQPPARARPATATPIQVLDDADHMVELPAPARRAVALAPHAVELAYEAGAGQYVVGAVMGSDYPPEARALPQVGDGLRPDPERVAALRPDLLIAWQPGALRTLAPVLQSQRPAVYVSDPRTLDDIPITLERLGILFGTEPVARGRAQALRMRLDTLTERYTGKPTVRVFVQAGARPLYALGDTGIIGDVLRRCGAVNVFADAGRAALQVSVESVLARQPEVIIAGTVNDAESEAFLRAWQASGVAAARRGHLYTLDADALYRPTARLVDAAETLCARIDAARSDGPARRGGL